MVSAASKISNLKYASWAPQKELFSNDKVKLFLTHCGANGVIEANYFGVKPLGAPITDEQYSVMTRLKNMGLSKQIKLNDNSHTIVEKVYESLYNDEEADKKVDKVRRIMEFEEVRGGQGLQYHLKYFTLFG